jgi:hypothetical protein
MMTMNFWPSHWNIPDPAHLPPRSALRNLSTTNQALVDAQISALPVTRTQPTSTRAHSSRP